MDRYMIIDGLVDGKRQFKAEIILDEAPLLTENDMQILSDAFSDIWDNGLFDIDVQMFGCDGEAAPSIAAHRADLARVTAERDRLLEVLSALECGPLNHLDNWANAYPEDVFIEPTREEWAAVNDLLKEHGYSMTALNGSVARHCVQGIQKYVREAIKLIEDAAKESEE